MITQATKQLFLKCTTEGCDGEWRVDHLNPGFVTFWSCEECHAAFRIARLREWDFEIEPTGMKDSPITVTLRSQTVPPITVKVNAWRYTHSQHDSKEEFEENERYLYDQHTCPTNWLSQVEEIEANGDRDPHGLFEFVSVEDGHYVDPDDMSYDARVKRGEVVEEMPSLSVEHIREIVKSLRNSDIKARKPGEGFTGDPV